MKTNWMIRAALFLLFALDTHGSVITLSAPASPTSTLSSGPGLIAMRVDHSIAASPLPTPAVNGMTKYEEVLYFTQIVAVYNKTTTITLLSTPTPVQTYTANHGASSRYASGAPGQTLSFDQKTDAPRVPNEIRVPRFVENCTMNTEENKGVCFKQILIDGPVPESNGPLVNSLYQFTGTLEAYATATVGAGSPTVSGPGRGMLGVGLLVCFLISISSGLFL